MIKANYISKENIKKIASDLLAKYYKFDHPLKNIHTQHYQIDTNILLDLCIDNNIIADYDFKEAPSKNHDILGQFIFNTKTIVIYNETSQNSILRENFTTAHEIGHAILHYKVWANNHTRKDFVCNRQAIEKTNHYTENDEAKLEWQANFFASCILMPDNIIIEHFDMFKALVDYGNFEITPKTREMYEYINNRDLIGFLSYSMKVSKTAVKIKLEEMELLIPCYLSEKDNEAFSKNHTYKSIRNSIK